MDLGASLRFLHTLIDRLAQKEMYHLNFLPKFGNFVDPKRL